MNTDKRIVSDSRCMTLDIQQEAKEAIEDMLKPYYNKYGESIYLNHKLSIVIELLDEGNLEELEKEGK